MACVTRTVYSSERNKGLSLSFQLSEEGWGIERQKRCDKDEGNSPKNINKVHRINFESNANMSLAAATIYRIKFQNECYSNKLG